MYHTANASMNNIKLKPLSDIEIDSNQGVCNWPPRVKTVVTKIENVSNRLDSRSIWSGSFFFEEINEEYVT